MEYIPSKDKKSKRVASVILAISCIGLIGASLLDVQYRLFYQLISLLVAVLSFEILYRYHLTTYIYAVQENDFVIAKRIGARTQTVCNLALSTLIAVQKTPKTKEEKQKFSETFGKALLRYNYCQSISPKISYTAVFAFNDKYARIDFEANATFVSFLENYLSKKSEMEEDLF